jgi:nicotinamide-nucleotide amidase
VGSEPIERLCDEVAALLVRTGRRLVLAESCTAGLVSASLAAVPGISRHHCGSAVTYRDGTKTQWLGVPGELLQLHSAVSDVVTQSMATNVLQRTPEADIAVAVTGHLGPDAPPEQDGRVFIAVAVRSASPVGIRITASVAFCLAATDRVSRQREATGRVLECLRQSLLARP